MSGSPKNGMFFKSLKSLQITVAVFLTTVFLTVATLIIYEESKSEVTLNLNGEELVVKTHANTVGKLLAKQGVEVSEYDAVEPSIATEVEEGLLVEWKQAKQVAIQVGSEEYSLWTTEQTVQKVLEEAGIEVTKHDEVTPKSHAEVIEDTTITVDKAYEFTFKDGTEEKKYWSTETTVEEFLEKEDIAVGTLDRLEIDKDELITPNAVVELVRVEKEQDVVEESADFAVETKKDDSLLKGREKVVQKGSKGKVEKTYEVIKENGKEVSRKVVEEKVVQEPTNQVVSVGTKVMVASASTATSTSTKSAATTSSKKAPSNVTVSRNDAAPSGGKEFYVEATAYTPYCNGCSGISAAGINLRANPNLKVIAVDPRVIPLGTKVWVEGYGYAVAGDTGGAIKGNRIDILVQTKSQAYSWGRKNVKIRVMN